MLVVYFAKLVEEGDIILESATVLGPKDKAH